MPELRGFVRDNVMDILYYSSAVNSQRIVDAISTQLDAKHATPPYHATHPYHATPPYHAISTQLNAKNAAAAAPGCNPMLPRLQPHASEAASLFHRRLQP